MVFLIAGLCSAVTQMVGGVLSDRFGRRPLLLGAAGIRVPLYLGMAVLIGVSAPIWAIVVVYIAQQSVGMMVHPATSAMVADLSPKDRLTETYGFLRVGRNVGWAAGPAVGGYLATFLPYSWLFGVAALTSVLAFWLILLFLRESFHGAAERVDLRSVFSVASDRTFLMFTGLSLLVFLAMGQMGSTLSVFTVDRLGFSTAQYGLLLTMNGLIVVFFQYPVARGTSRLTKSTALILGSLLYGLGYLSLGWTASFAWALVAIAVITAGEIVFSPSTLAVVGELSSQGRRGRYMGFFGLSETLGISVGPLVGGVLLDAFPTDPRFIWGTIALVAFAAAAGFHWWGHQTASQ
jgi:MFS family permease